MSPAGAWDALARLLPAECPRRDLEAVAPSAPAGTDRAAGASWPHLSPEPAEPAAPRSLGLVASPAARRAPARAASPACAGAWWRRTGPRPPGDALARARAAT